MPSAVNIPVACLRGILIRASEQCKQFVPKDIDSLGGNMLRTGSKKALLQRVSSARITVDGQVVGEIQKALLVFLCATKGDTEKGPDYLIKKVSQHAKATARPLTMPRRPSRRRGCMRPLSSVFRICVSRFRPACSRR